MELNNVDDGVHLGLLLTWRPGGRGVWNPAGEVLGKQDAQPPPPGFPRVLLAGALRGSLGQDGRNLPSTLQARQKVRRKRGAYAWPVWLNG